MERCHVCESSEDDTSLYKCPSCFKWICEKHVHRAHGRDFCSPGCATFHYFTDDDPEDQHDEE